MCNEFQRHKLLKDAIEEFDRRGLPLFRWKDGLIPNMLDAQPAIRIRVSAWSPATAPPASATAPSSCVETVKVWKGR